MNSLQILNAGARINDSVALERLLRGLPKAEQLRPFLGSDFAKSYYDSNARRAILLISDGEILLAYTITDIDPEEAACVREHLDEIDYLLSPQELADIVSRALGLDLESVPEELGMIC